MTTESTDNTEKNSEENQTERSWFNAAKDYIKDTVKSKAAEFMRDPIGNFFSTTSIITTLGTVITYSVALGKSLAENSKDSDVNTEAVAYTGLAFFMATALLGTGAIIRKRIQKNWLELANLREDSSALRAVLANEPKQDNSIKESVSENLYIALKWTSFASSLAFYTGGTISLVQEDPNPVAGLYLLFFSSATLFTGIYSTSQLLNIAIESVSVQISNYLNALIEEHKLDTNKTASIAGLKLSHQASGCAVTPASTTVTTMLAQLNQGKAISNLTAYDRKNWSEWKKAFKTQPTFRNKFIVKAGSVAATSAGILAFLKLLGDAIEGKPANIALARAVFGLIMSGLTGVASVKGYEANQAYKELNAVGSLNTAIHTQTMSEDSAPYQKPQIKALRAGGAMIGTAMSIAASILSMITGNPNWATNFMGVAASLFIADIAYLDNALEQKLTGVKDDSVALAQAAITEKNVPAISSILKIFSSNDYPNAAAIKAHLRALIERSETLDAEKVSASSSTSAEPTAATYAIVPSAS